MLDVIPIYRLMGWTPRPTLTCHPTSPPNDYYLLVCCEPLEVFHFNLVFMDLAVFEVSPLVPTIHTKTSYEIASNFMVTIEENPHTTRCPQTLV